MVLLVFRYIHLFFFYSWYNYILDVLAATSVFKKQADTFEVKEYNWKKKTEIN